MILVRIRCKAPGCGRLLHEVTEAPNDWSAGFAVKPCSRHGPGSAGRQRRVLFVQWRVLGTAIMEAMATGKTQEHAL